MKTAKYNGTFAVVVFGRPYIYNAITYDVCMSNKSIQYSYACPHLSRLFLTVKCIVWSTHMWNTKYRQYQLLCLVNDDELRDTCSVRYYGMD
jgi:hypothetical protein